MSERTDVRKLLEGFEPPPELARGRPRPVELTAGGMAVSIVAAVLLAAGIGLGTWLWVVAERDLQRGSLLDRTSQEGDAQVERLWRTGKNNSTCRVDYSFDAGGKPYHATATLRCAAWRTLAVGQTVPVQYVPSDPTISRLPGLGGRSDVPWWAAPLVGIGMGFAGLLLIWRVRLERKLVEEGKPAPGVVTKLGARTDKGRYVYYEFATQSGAPGRGRWGPVHGKSVPEVGARILVLYEPDNTRRNTAYPSKFARVRKPR